MASNKSKINTLIQISESNKGRYSLEINYDHSVPVSASGSLFLERFNSSTKTKILGSSAELTAMWLSQSGHPWCVDIHGNVYSSAAVRFDKRAKRARRTDFSISIDWQVTSVSPTSLNLISGTSNSDVWVAGTATENGVAAVYHFDGKTWTDFSIKNCGDIFSLCYVARELFVSSYRHLYKFNNGWWERFDFASIKDLDADNFRPIAITASAPETVVCSLDGQIIKGSFNDGFKVLKKSTEHFISAAFFQNDLYFASLSNGVFRLTNDTLVQVSDIKSSSTLCPAISGIYFISDEGDPSFRYESFNPARTPSLQINESVYGLAANDTTTKLTGRQSAHSNRN